MLEAAMLGEAMLAESWLAGPGLGEQPKLNKLVCFDFFGVENSSISAENLRALSFLFSPRFLSSLTFSLPSLPLVPRFLSSLALPLAFSVGRSVGSR